MLSNDIQPVTANCPSGNCTWPITPSLAVCGACAASTYTLACGNSFCNYTMPSGSVIPLINPEKVDYGTGFAVVSGKGSKWNSSIYDKLYIANFDVVGAPAESLICPNCESVRVRHVVVHRSVQCHHQLWSSTPNRCADIFVHQFDADCVK